MKRAVSQPQTDRQNTKKSGTLSFAYSGRCKKTELARENDRTMKSQKHNALEMKCAAIVTVST